MSLVSRFLRLPGTEERYLDFLSEVSISRRARDALVHGASADERAEWDSRAERGRLGRLLSDYAREQELGRVQGQAAADFFLFAADLRDPDNSPTGDKAKALMKFGRRRLDWDFPVGETPE